MIHLEGARLGGYCRALSAAVSALAPDVTWPPLAECLAHLQALDPALSGDVLAPAEVMPETGMPAWTWLERASAEAVVARSGEGGRTHTEAELQRIAALDPALGERMACRQALHGHLRERTLLPHTRLTGAVRSLEPHLDLHLSYDRIAPDGRWERIGIELRCDAMRPAQGVALREGGRVEVSGALRHLLTRHYATELVALQQQVEEATSARVRRLSRGWIGPFWFPGIPVPSGVPEVLGTGLVLHGAHEVTGSTLQVSGHLDPLVPPCTTPMGRHLFRERRLAVSANLQDAAHAWFAAAGMRGTVHPIGAPRRRRL